MLLTKSNITTSEEEKTAVLTLANERKLQMLMRKNNKVSLSGEFKEKDKNSIRRNNWKTSNRQLDKRLKEKTLF
ncbi:MAG TPA: hypothetical protein VNW29_00100 [Candidatus Sulfotelmatobacter sp.]|jgi:hypothetical protein|nr:hypothetical protein [Candidatus Sulfotelmatobacter sp.]